MQTVVLHQKTFRGYHPRKQRFSTWKTSSPTRPWEAYGRDLDVCKDDIDLDVPAVLMEPFLLICSLIIPWASHKSHCQRRSTCRIDPWHQCTDNAARRGKDSAQKHLQVEAGLHQEPCHAIRLDDQREGGTWQNLMISI